MSRNPVPGRAGPVVGHVAVVQVIAASPPAWIAPFTGLQPGRFRKVVRLVANRSGDEIADGRAGPTARSPRALQSPEFP